MIVKINTKKPLSEYNPATVFLTNNYTLDVREKTYWQSAYSQGYLVNNGHLYRGIPGNH